MRTLAPVAGGALPGEEAEGTVPRVLELAVRHPRLLLLTCGTSQQTHQIRREHGKGGSIPRRGNGHRRQAKQIQKRGEEGGRRRRRVACSPVGGGGARGTGGVGEDAGHVNPRAIYITRARGFGLRRTEMPLEMLCGLGCFSGIQG